jgi:hypothetical protein
MGNDCEIAMFGRDKTSIPVLSSGTIVPFDTTVNAPWARRTSLEIPKVESLAITMFSETLPIGIAANDR